MTVDFAAYCKSLNLSCLNFLNGEVKSNQLKLSSQLYIMKRQAFYVSYRRLNVSSRPKLKEEACSIEISLDEHLSHEFTLESPSVIKRFQQEIKLEIIVRGRIINPTAQVVQRSCVHLTHRYTQ